MKTKRLPPKVAQEVAKKVVGALAAGALLLAACGDDDGGSSAESNEYTDALAASIADDEDVQFSEDQADCLAREFVAGVGGVDAFEAEGITPEEVEESDDISELGLDPEQMDTEALEASFGNCDVSLKDVIVEAMASDAEVSDEQRQCIQDALADVEDDQLAKVFAGMVVTGEQPDPQDFPPELVQAFFSCA